MCWYFIGIMAPPGRSKLAMFDQRTHFLSAWALKFSQRPSVIPRFSRNPNLPLKSEMFRIRFAPLNMTPFFLPYIDCVINFAQPLRSAIAIA